MFKVTMIGAGSVVFVKNLLTDILDFEALRDAPSPSTISTRNAWKRPA